MTKYIAQFEFGSDVTPEEAQEWTEAIQENLPKGTAGRVKAVPLVLNIEDVTEAHAGNKATVYLGAPRGYVRGILESVYITGGTAGIRRTLIVDGQAYDVPAYGTVELSEW